MENNEKQRKFLSGMSGAFQKATDLSKKAVDEIQKGAKALSEKTQNDSYERRMKKYNPLFPQDMDLAGFKLPSIIEIVDKIVRKDVDVCEGAVGWTSVEKETEVLHIYKEETDRCGVQFIPFMDCNSVYYVDRFDPQRYIKVDCIFAKAVEEKLAELKQIAYVLGAKRCSVVIENSRVEKKKGAIAVGVGLGMKSVSNEQTSANETGDYRSGSTSGEFAGNDTPKRPKLKWFADDDNIKQLIEARISDPNSIKSDTLKLEGAYSATMSIKAASAINSLLGKSGVAANLNLETKAEEEHRSKLSFHIEF